MFHLERLDSRTNYELRRTPVEKSPLVRPYETSRTLFDPGYVAVAVSWLSARSSASSRQVHRVGHRNEYFARSLEALPPMRGADVVHEHHIAGLPRLTGGVCLIGLVDRLHDVRAD